MLRSEMQFLQLSLLAKVQLAIPNAYSSPLMSNYISPVPAVF